MQVNIAEIHVFIEFCYLVQFFIVDFYLNDLSLSKISRVYAYLGAYAYLFRELFQSLCLFGGLCLLGSLEYFHLFDFVTYLRKPGNQNYKMPIFSNIIFKELS